MPYYSRKRAFPRRAKRYRYKRYRRKPRVSAVTSKTWVVPDRIRTKLNYQERITISASTGTLGSHIFRLNSLYDTNQSGSGNQPVGYDQLSALYQKYRVHGVKVKLRAVSQGTTNATSMYDLAMVPQLESPSWSNIEDATGNPYRKWTMSGNSNTRPTVLSAYFPIAKLFGESLADDSYASGVGSDPANVAFLYILAQSVDRSSTTSVIIDVSLTFYCDFFQRQSLSLS